MLIAEKLGLILQTFTKWGKLNSEEKLYFLLGKWTGELNVGTFVKKLQPKIIICM